MSVFQNMSNIIRSSVESFSRKEVLCLKCWYRSKISGLIEISMVVFRLLEGFNQKEHGLLALVLA